MIDFHGKFGASSHHPGHPARHGFVEVGNWPWANSEGQFPAFIWHWFHEIHVVAKFGFASRIDLQNLNQSPKSFYFVGSMDCSNWTTIIKVDDAGFTKNNQFKSWIIPKRGRQAFRCFGFELLSTIDSTHVSLR